MPGLTHPKPLTLPDCRANDTLLFKLASGNRRPHAFSCTPGDHNQTTQTKNTDSYENPVLLIIIFLMFGLNLSVHLYCASYLMSHL